jgi:TRAP-type C4-dicarboxylate transport system permease large subunit
MKTININWCTLHFLFCLFAGIVTFVEITEGGSGNDRALFLSNTVPGAFIGLVLAIIVFAFEKKKYRKFFDEHDNKNEKYKTTYLEKYILSILLILVLLYDRYRSVLVVHIISAALCSYLLFFAVVLFSLLRSRKIFIS